ncbi:MAG: response regulator [Candidatus Cyclonatronum sp.]|uniref:hybrid sensor histidine kinase/response regulator transcription factor n=1 Tax=Cyclonatronum sp. TaxID=3024185 RepID=UPI0025C3E1C1|nr:response regulator [Cyclonatronum sp.]MCH8487350.1 response regulator [Cyclonatronum sp.]
MLPSILLSLIWAAIAGPLQFFQAGQHPEYIIKHYTTIDGLPLNSVIGMVQKGDGFIYMATLDGLVRYDGYEFKVFNAVEYPELGNNRVQNIGIDEEGLLWLGTTYGIVSSFDGKQFRIFNPDEPHPFRLQHRILPQFMALGTELGMILGTHPDTVRSYYLQQMGSLLEIDSKTLRIDGQLILSDPQIMGGFYDQEGTIWVFTYNTGLYQIKRSPVRNITQIESIPVQNIYSVIELPGGDILAGNLIDGTVHFSESEVTISRVDFGDFPLDRSRFLFYDEQEDQLYKSLFSPGLWMHENGKWVHQDWFRSLFPGTDSRVDAMHRTQSGLLLMGTPAGMLVKQQGEFRLLEELTGQKFNFVRVIRELSDGTLLLGTNGFGLFILKPDWSWKRYTTREGLSSNFIRDIYPETDQRIWLATEDHGLNFINFGDEATISSTTITRHNGLISNALHRIIPDRYGYLWINTNGGIMRTSLEQLHAFVRGDTYTLTPLKLNENNGLHNREGNGGVDNAGLQLSNGLIVFPNQAGLIVINPSALQAVYPRLISQPIIDRIETAGQTYRTTAGSGKGIHLDPGERDFRIHFTLPNFENPNGIIFSYQLIGFDRTPQLAGNNRTAFYTNVPPGNYSFLVTAAGFDGYYKEVLIPLSVPSFFYETTLFYFFCALGILILLGGIYKLRVKSMETKEQFLSRQIDEKTRELKKASAEVRKASVARSRLFTSISHELKTPISLITGPLAEVRRHPAMQQDPILQDYLSIVQDNSYRLKNLVDQILQVTKLNADALNLKITREELVSLTRNELARLADVSSRKSVSLKLTAQPPAIEIFVDTGVWERIITNLIYNALRYSPEGGEVLVNIRQDETHVSCIVSDQGPGISNTDLPRVFEYLYQGNEGRNAEGTGIGLYLVKELTGRLGGNIVAYNAPAGGAVFKITLKRGSGHLNPGDLAPTTEEPEEPVYADSADTQDISRPELKPVTYLFPAAVQKPKPETEKKKEKAKAKETAKSKPVLLLVEDNSDFRIFIASALADHFVIYQAANGLEALPLLKKKNPDLLISDVMMPGMDGITLVRKIREMPAFRTLPVLFISAKDELQDIEKGLSSGADVYLTKPVNPDTILKQIYAMLRREKLIRHNTKTTETYTQASGSSQPDSLLNGNDTGQFTKTSEDAAFEKKVKELILRHLGNTSLTTQLIADSLYISRAQLYRKWEKVESVPLNKYITKTRIQEACQLINSEGYSVSDAANAVGYQHASYFSTVFRKETGETPTEWLQKQTSVNP